MGVKNMRLAMALLAAFATSVIYAADVSTGLPFSVANNRILADYDFNELTNLSKSVKNCTGLLTNSLACFSGDMLRIPTNSIGVIQISTSSNRGFLRYNGDVAASDTLFVLACKRPSSLKSLKLSIDRIAPGGITNNLQIAELSTDFKWFEVHLDKANGQGTLIFQPCHSKGNSIIYTNGSNRVLLIDRIVFTRKRTHGFYITIH